MKSIITLIIFTLFCITSYAQEVSSFTTDDGETLFYTKIGEGEKVVLLNGGPGFGVNFLEPIADTLSEKLSCILFDQRGTGLSAKAFMDSTTINLNRAIQDIETLRIHLGTNEISLFGFSWGAVLAQAYSASFPDRVKNMVLLSPASLDPTLSFVSWHNLIMRMYPEEKDSITFWRQKPEHELSQFKIMLFRLIPYFYDHDQAYELLPDILQTVPYNRQMGRLMSKDKSRISYLEKLKNYNGKCHIIRGRQDFIPSEIIYQIKDILPQTIIMDIEQSGHYPHLEQAEQFYEKLKIAYKE